MNSDIPIHLDLSNFDSNGNGTSEPHEFKEEIVKTRRRSNSQSHVIATPNLGLTPRDTQTLREEPKKRKQYQYFVTLTSLNDTFVQKHFSVPYHPETRKLGRPTGTKIKPDVTNGFFDSRVLSRNHAAMYIDNKTGKLMLKDLGSSNGTFVNSEKLDTEPVEIKVGDTIFFGFSIQAGMNHKQIMSKVDSIDIMSNLIKSFDTPNPQLNSSEFQHYQFIEDLYKQITKEEAASAAIEKGQGKTHDKPPVSFDAAMFSDVNPEIEDSLLGLYTKVNNGIFKNSGTSATIKLEEAMNLLINCFTNIKQQNSSLSSLELFVSNYKNRLNQLNEDFLQQQYNSKLTEFNEKLDKEKANNEKISNEFKVFKDENYKKSKKLEEKVYKLKDEKQDLNKKINQLNEILQEKEFKIIELESHKPIDLQPKRSLDIIIQDQNGTKLSLEDLEDAKEPNTSDISLPDEPTISIPKSISKEPNYESSYHAEPLKPELIKSEFIKPEHIQLNRSTSSIEIEEKETDQLDLDHFEDDNDLRYGNSGIYLGLTALILGVIIHKYLA